MDHALRYVPEVIYAILISICAACLGGCFSVQSNATATFTITESGDGNETVSPSAVQTVDSASTQNYTVSANSGYQVNQSVGGTCPSGSWSGSSYTTGAITANCTVSFSASVAYTVTPSTDGNETVTPNAAQTLVLGSTQVFTVAAHTGYQLSGTVGGTCPAGSWSGSTYTTGQITGNCTVSFSASILTYTVTPSGDGHEMLSPSTVQTVDYGTTQSFTVTPNSGYATSSTTGGTCPAGTWSGTAYTTGTITANCTVSFTAATSYTVTPSGDGHETISPNSVQTVGSGSTQAFTVTASSGYTLSNTVGGTCAAGSWSGSTYRTGAITANCSVTFSASVTTYVVTPSGDGNEALSPSTAQTVNTGGTQQFTVTATSGFTLSSTVGGTCPAGSWSGSVYTTGAITANCTVTFSVSSRTLTALTSTTGTDITTYFMSPESNQMGSSACNADYYPGTSGTNCTAYSRTCAQVQENTTSCNSSRTALGLSGNWLLFSCNVTLGLAYKSGGSFIATTTFADATYVSLTTDDFPTYTSNYYPSSGTYSFTAYGITVSGLFSSLYAAYTPAFPDPGQIATPTSTETMYVPLTPSPCTGASCSNGSSSPNIMNMGATGVAVNGAFIFSSIASETDNIFAEDGSFDQCDGHPAGSQYHYHSEPYAISYNDSNIIGVMMDGYWVYGRQDAGGTVPGTLAKEESGDSGTDNTIYFFGGHVGDLPNDTGVSQFHYHLTEWIGCYDETSSVHGYTFQDNGVTYDTFNSSNFSSSTGPASPSSGGNTYCGGTWVDAWMLTGHGNGGVFETPSNIGNGGVPGTNPVWTNSTATISSGSYNAPAVTWSCGGSGSTACLSQTTAGLRYYYGTPGACPNCQ